ncbi:MAG: potassium-transporting ATPase subunit KdpA [Burkholderiaceae bacterium]
MRATDIGQLVAFGLVLLVASYPLGLLMARIATPAGFASRWLTLPERGLYRIAGVDRGKGMTWVEYALAVIVFNVIGALVVYALQRLQAALPLNPAAMTAVTPDSSFNTAISFVTNTNWQGYGGESTMSYLTQMVGLTVQNFLSAATGIAVAFALIRALAARASASIGNFWVDLTRITLYVLLPLSLVLAVVQIQQGSVQNFDTYRDATTVEVTAYDNPKLGPDGQPLKDDKGVAITEPAKTPTQTIAMGPVASQESIKVIGTNGGGFFNANSAHPFENPTPLTNFLQMLAIFLIPAGLVFTFGKVVGDMRQGWAVFAAMAAIFVVMAGVVIWSELHANPLLTSLGVDGSLGNMEGKETRFGAVGTALFVAVTTSASCGAVNAMHDSLLPLGGLVPMWLMQFGEVVFGGVGSGLYGALMYAIVAVFIAGLMIGRTPEYIGKKIEAYDMKMVALAILATSMLVLICSAIAVVVEPGKAGVANPGAHGFSEILYAFSSAANNNGSAFAGLSANTPFYNVMLGIAMWFGRFGVIVPVLAIAGSLARKKRIEVTSGTLPTHGLLFVVLLVSTIVLIGALTYVPALALGPVIEHLQLFATH